MGKFTQSNTHVTILNADDLEVDSPTLSVDATNDRVGVGVVDPDSKLEVLATTTQIKASYDADSFATITVANSSNTTIATGESGDLTLDAAGDIVLDADGDQVSMKFGGAAGQIDFTNENSGDGVIQQKVDAKDLVVKQFDGTEVARFSDAGNVLVKKDLYLTTDGSSLFFGQNAEIELKHGHDDGLSLISSLTNKPQFTLENTNDAADAPILRFLKSHDTSVGADDDVIGTVLFRGENTSGNYSFGRIVHTVVEADQNSEQSKTGFQVAANSGGATIYTGFEVAGTSTAGVVDVNLPTDGGSINFGADSDVSLTHVHNAGLILKHNSTTDGTFPKLTFQTGDNAIIANNILGQIDFQAPDDSGADSDLVGASIVAIAEGTFSDSNNATSLQFRTGASEVAATKMTLDSAGLLTCDGGVKIGNMTIKINQDGDNNDVLMASSEPFNLQSAGGVTFKSTGQSVVLDGNSMVQLKKGTAEAFSATAAGTLRFPNDQAATLFVQDSANTAAGKNLTISAGNAIAGGSNNLAGGVLTLASGVNKGNTTAGEIVFKTCPPEGSGNTVGTLTNRVAIVAQGQMRLYESPGDPSAAAGSGWIFSKQDGGNTEVHVMDYAGNVTKISPHDESGDWEYFSKNTKTGKVVRIKMEKLLKRLNEQFGEEDWFSETFHNDEEI